MKLRTIIFWILTLVIADQIIKIIINIFFIENQFEIIPSLFEFRPKFNDKHNYVNVLLYENFHINMGLWVHLIIVLTIETIVLILYDSLRSNLVKNRKLLDTAFVFQLSGVVCNFIGNLIWKNGTLDYIYLKPLFIFDLKDLYNNCFVVLFLIYFHKNRTEMKTIKMKKLKHYFGKGKE